MHFLFVFWDNYCEAICWANIYLPVSQRNSKYTFFTVWKHSFFLPELMPVRRDCRENWKTLSFAALGLKWAWRTAMHIQQAIVWMCGYKGGKWTETQGGRITASLKIFLWYIMPFALVEVTGGVCEVGVNLTPGCRRWHKSSVCTDRLPVRWFGAERQDRNTGRMWTQTYNHQPNNH